MSDILHNELFEAFASASDNVYIYVCDMATNISRWSRSALEYFGLPSEYIEDAGNVWASYVHPDDLEAYNDDISKVFSGQKRTHDCQYRARNRNGEYVWVECKGSVIRGEDGTPKVFAGLMTRIGQQSKYDYLTGLLTTQSLSSYDFSSQPGVSMLVGLDSFRAVVSSLGYNTGNDILVEFSKKVKSLCKPGWKVLRFNGDEFLVLAFSASRDEAIEFYDRMKQEAETIELKDGRRVSLSFSGGGVLFPQNADAVSSMIDKLEHSLEYAKITNRGTLAFFSEEISKKGARRMILREDLFHSVKNGFSGFELFFQPFVNPDTQSIVGCESLLRWKGEQIKDSYPMEFIKVLEDYGYIREVGFWVMEEAIRQQVAWRGKYSNLLVSFNVSYQQFLDDSFEERLCAYAEEYGVDPTYIIIELTESCAADDPQRLAAIFTRLREKGFKIALDDFGTAYASLEMLKYLQVDYIKVEHSFVRELSEPGHDIDYAIIDSLLEMCKNLGYNTIVEGVENNKVADIVRNMDATLLQGYYYSRPVCRSDFEKLLDADRAKAE